MFKQYSQAVQAICKIVAFAQGVMGLTMGLYLYSWGPLFYEKFLTFTDAHLAMTLTTAFFAILMGLGAFLEVPMGAVGDAIGRKKTFVWSLFCRILFFVFMGLISFINHFGSVIFAVIIALASFSFSYTLYSGTFTAWCVDSLKSADPKLGYEHILSKGYSIHFACQIVGGVIGVILYMNGIAYVGHLFAALACLACLIYCLAEMKEDSTNSYVRLDGLTLVSTTKRIGEIIGVGFQMFRRSPPILMLVLVFASYMVVLNIVDYLWPVYLRDKISEDLQIYYWPGLVIITLLASTLGSNLLTFFSKRKSHLSKTTKTENTSLIKLFTFSCLMACGPIILLSYLTHVGGDSFWVFVFSIFPVMFAYGVIGPCFETLINNYIPDEHSNERATIMSFGSLLRSLLIMLLAIPSGGKDAASTTIGWAIPAVILIVVTITGYFVLMKSERHQQVVGEIHPA